VNPSRFRGDCRAQDLFHVNKTQLHIKGKGRPS
jgi:hypothetical protein